MDITSPGAGLPGLYKSDDAINAGYVDEDKRRADALDELREAIKVALPALLRVDDAYREFASLGETIKTAAVDGAAEFALDELGQALVEIG